MEFHAWVVEKVGQRPIFVSEYMARTLNVTFFSHSIYIFSYFKLSINFTFIIKWVL
jgi:hypothetical protein